MPMEHRKLKITFFNNNSNFTTISNKILLYLFWNGHEFTHNTMLITWEFPDYTWHFIQRQL